MRRIKEHQKSKKGWKLVYYEAYLSNKDARKRERMLKSHGSSLGHLKNRVEDSFRKGGMLNITAARSARK